MQKGSVTQFPVDRDLFSQRANTVQSGQLFLLPLIFQTSQDTPMMLNGTLPDCSQVLLGQVHGVNSKLARRVAAAVKDNAKPVAIIA